jgi:hypothetical protein
MGASQLHTKGLAGCMALLLLLLLVVLVLARA